MHASTLEKRPNFTRRNQFKSKEEVEDCAFKKKCKGLMKEKESHRSYTRTQTEGLQSLRSNLLPHQTLHDTRANDPMSLSKSFMMSELH